MRFSFIRFEWRASFARSAMSSPDLPSALRAERRLAVLVGHLLAEVGDLGSNFKHDPLDAPPRRKITARHTPRRQARQDCQRDTRNAVDEGINVRPAHEFVPFLHQAQLQDLGLDRDVGSIGLCAR